MVFILGLLLLNALLAMAEIAIITAKKHRLEKMAKEGDVNARIALALTTNPTTFLSTIQVGITFVGILAGASSETALTRQIEQFVSGFGIEMFIIPITRVVVVALTGFLFIVFGELVPKRIAMHAPERIAVIISPLMQAIAFAAAPIVHLLSKSTDLVMHMLQLKAPPEQTISEEEVKLLIKEGTRAGVFEASEKDIVERTLHLGDKRVSQLMTPRKEIISLHPQMTFHTMLETIVKHPHSYFPIVGKNIDSCIGVVHTKTLLANFLIDREKSLKKSLEKQLVIPEHMNALKALEMFKKTKMHMALIVDEYGTVQGLISLTDILEGIVGDIPSDTPAGGTDFVQRQDGTWLVNGLVTLDEFREFFDVKKPHGLRSSDIHTIGGFITNQLGKVPQVGDICSWENIHFEVVDMDGSRMDKVLVSGIKVKKTKAS